MTTEIIYEKLYISLDEELKLLKRVKAELEKFGYAPTWGEDCSLDVMGEYGDYQVSITPLGDIAVKADIPFVGGLCYWLDSSEELIQLMETDPEEGVCI